MEVMRHLLLCMLEIVEGEVCLLEVLETTSFGEFNKCWKWQQVLENAACSCPLSNSCLLLRPLFQLLRAIQLLPIIQLLSNININLNLLLDIQLLRSCSDIKLLWRRQQGLEAEPSSGGRFTSMVRSESGSMR